MAKSRVALLAEGVDRNCQGAGAVQRLLVALLAEGVDRNRNRYCLMGGYGQSPSSRRAWIEIRLQRCLPCHTSVALLAEGVDRNLTLSLFLTAAGVALLAEGVDRNKRTASSHRPPFVALLAEGVDRNCDGECVEDLTLSRPPRGGRG